MNSEYKQKWVEALRSGKYRQGKYALRSMRETYCCLGVLYDILPNVRWEYYNKSQRYKAFYGEDSQGSITSLTLDLMNHIDMPYRFENELINMNDSDGKSFDEIADFIEKEL